MKKFMLIFILTFLVVSILPAQSGGFKHHAQLALDCQKCHICKDPTYNNPCVKVCPDFMREGVSVHHSVEDAPETIVIDTLSNLYEASIFTHRLHAEMSLMAGGCVFCHHHNPPGQVLACIGCHKPSNTDRDLNKPNLKGAYHQQCLNCHRSWNSAWKEKNDCVSCHAPKGSETRTEAENERLQAVKHPPLKVPDKIVFETEFEDQPLVTFFHDTHSGLFGYDCADCHQNESCNGCHSTHDKKQIDEHEAHANCMACHEEAINEDCGKCHGTEEKEPFNHGSTGWELGKHHRALSCQKCHGSDGNFSRLNKNCTSCHKNFLPGRFNHAVTGLKLDETHAEFECVVCHEDRDFSRATVCNMCHDGFSFPKNKPGRMQ